MCRYGITSYKLHYACFNCRKTFKRRLLGDIKNGAPEESFDAKCPECGGLMADMGLDFESPKKTDLKAWKHIESLYQSGITFHSCGCVGPGYIPINKEDHLNTLKFRRENFVKCRNEWAGHHETSEKDLPRSPLTKGYRRYVKNQPSYQETMDYWVERINMIDQRIKELSF